MRAFLLFLLLLADVLRAEALTADNSRDLINQGRNYLYGDSIKADSAAICFSKVVQSYRDGLSEEQKYRCAVAAVNLGSVYFHYIGDYKKAYETLLKAAEIDKNINRPIVRATITMQFGSTYSLFADQVDSPEFIRLCNEENKKAFRIACENKLWNHAVVVFCNISSRTWRPDFKDEFSDEIRQFEKLPIPEGTNDLEYARQRLTSVRLLLDRDTVAAIESMKREMEMAPATDNAAAYIHQNLRSLSYIYHHFHMPDSALLYADRLLKHGHDFQDYEAMTEAYKVMEQIYREESDEDAADKAHAQFLIHQDSLLNYQHLGSVDNLKFINDLALERHQSSLMLAEENRKRKLRELLVFFTGLLLAIITPLLLVIINRHRKLRKSYIDLFRRQQEILLKEKENRQLREDEISMQSKILDSAKESASYIAPSSAVSQKTRILSIMDETDEKFSSDFSLERLAELVGISSRALSAVLNDSLGTSFRELLNQYRVREACARLEDKAGYGHLTIEAISQSVGYKLRTSLVTAFKKETGLTPSDYQRIARKSKP